MLTKFPDGWSHFDWMRRMTTRATTRATTRVDHRTIYTNNYLFIVVGALAWYTASVCTGCLAGTFNSSIEYVLRWAIVASFALTAFEFVLEKVVGGSYAGLRAIVLFFVVVIPVLCTYAGVATAAMVPRWYGYVFAGVLALSLGFLWKSGQMQRKAAAAATTSWRQDRDAVQG